MKGFHKPSGGYLKKGAGVFFFSMAVHFVNYLFQMCAGRILSVEEFGDINVFLSALAVFSVPGAAVQMYVSRETASLRAAGATLRLRIFFDRAKPAALGVFLVSGSAYLAFVGWRQWPFNLCFLFLLLFYDVLYVYMGIAQGCRSFYFMYFLSLIPAVFRLAGAAVSAWAGQAKIFCILGFFAAGILAGDAVGYRNINRFHKKARISRKNVDAWLEEAKEIGKLSLSYLRDPIMPIQLGQAAMANMDLLLVKCHFGKEEAGLYSSAALLSRVLVYAVSSIVAILFPLAVTETGTKARSLYRKTLLLSLGIMAVLLLPALAAPQTLLRLFVGEKYSLAGAYMLYSLILAVFTGCHTLNLNYGISQGRTKVLSGSFLVYGMGCAALAFCHVTSVKALLAGLVFLGGLLFFWNFFSLQGCTQKRKDGGNYEE